jgi:hypothetical protein
MAGLSGVRSDLLCAQAQLMQPAAANWHDGQITSDFQKSCQAQESIRIKNILLPFSPKSAA